MTNKLMTDPTQQAAKAYSDLTDIQNRAASAKQAIDAWLYRLEQAGQMPYNNEQLDELEQHVAGAMAQLESIMPTAQQLLNG